MILFFITPNLPMAQTTAPPISSWREHLPYNSTIDVMASSKQIFAAIPYSLFAIDLRTGEVERMSKITGLSEIGINTIQVNKNGKQLSIAYTNCNIDILDEKGKHTIPDIKRRTIAGDKRNYHIYQQGNICYLSKGTGVIVIDAAKFEVKDTWMIGKNGGTVKTYMLTNGHKRHIQ